VFVGGGEEMKSNKLIVILKITEINKDKLRKNGNLHAKSVFYH